MDHLCLLFVFTLAALFGAHRQKTGVSKSSSPSATSVWILSSGLPDPRWCYVPFWVLTGFMLSGGLSIADAMKQ